MMPSEGAVDLYEIPSQEASLRGSSSDTCASFHLLLLQFMSQMRESQDSRVSQCERELTQERDKYSTEKNSTLEAEKKMAEEMIQLRLQARQLVDQKREMERLLSKATQEVEGRRGEIKRLEESLNRARQERRNILSGLQIENKAQMRGLLVELRQNLTTSLLKAATQNGPGTFINATLNQYVQNKSRSCSEKVNQLDLYLRQLPSLLEGRNATMALLEATKLNEIPEMEALISTGIPLDKSNPSARTYLWWAAHNGFVGACQLLLANGARVDAISPGSDYPTALHVAAFKGHLKVVQLLVENGGDIDIKNKAGQTVIFDASKQGHLNVVKYLINQGADLEDTDFNGKSVIEVATPPVAKWFKDRAQQLSKSG